MEQTRAMLESIYYDYKARTADIRMLFIPERDEIRLTCSGKHDQKFSIRLGKENKEAEPFNGEVLLPSSVFGEFFLGIVGGVSKSQDLGVDSRKVRVSRKGTVIRFTFTDYRNAARTVVNVGGGIAVSITGFARYIKDNIKCVRFTHTEKGRTLFMEYLPLQKVLKFITPAGDATLSGKEIYDLKELARLVLGGAELIRSYRFVSNGSVILVLPDGKMNVLGRTYGNGEFSLLKKIGYVLS